ncbi:MAG: ATP-binding protein [Pseudomonadota bacterium]
MSALQRWFSKPYDLRHAFLLGVILPLTGLSASVVLVMVNWAQESLEARLQGEIELISRAVAPAISNNLDEGRTAEIRSSLESLFSIRRVYGAAVYDEDGELVVAAGTADQDVRASNTASGVVRTGEEEGGYRSVEGENVYSYFTPLIDHGGRIHGLLQITRDRREIDASVREVRSLAWLFWLLAMGVTAALTLVVYRPLVGRHVQVLLQRMTALARGERHVTFEPSSPREFAEIGAGFNGMVESIRATEEELRRRQRREQELQQKLDESERVAMIGRVAQGLAHELGSPLSVVDGRVRRLQAKDGDGRFTRALDDVRRQVVRMSDIVRQLLNYGRDAAGDRTEVDLYRLLQRLRAAADAEDVAIHIDSGSPRVSVVGDPVRLELAVSNLVRNAVRHARSRVDVGLRRLDDGRIGVYVEDDGPGVSEADLAHVFEPFYTRQPPGMGTGLGLAIVANVMREHDGEARYENRPGGGARFVLVLPPAGEERMQE